MQMCKVSGGACLSEYSYLLASLNMCSFLNLWRNGIEVTILPNKAVIIPYNYEYVISF